MSTITKEFTKEQLQQIEAAAKEVLWPVVWSEKKAREHFSEKITPKVVLKLARIALASLEAEPRGYIDADTPDDGVSILTENKLLKTDIALYTAPPAPANAEPVAWLWSHRKHPSEVTLVRPEDDERAEGAHWSGWSCQALYAAQPAPVSVPDEITPKQASRAYCGEVRGYRDGWNACRDAMLHGKAEPVSNRDELPVSEIECDICGFKSTDPDGAHYCCEDNSND